MVFNLVLDKSKYSQFLKTIENTRSIKLIQQLDALSIMTVETTKKSMIELMKRHSEIVSVEKDGKVFAI